jgi:chorismate-pyruvate lyase
MSTTNGFDPLQSLLRAQPERPPELGAVNLRVLSPFQRALLVIDGTVTKFIEAYAMEPLEIDRLSQSTLLLEEDHPWLDAEKGTEVAVREVLIQGKYSRTPFVYAVSLVVLDRLPETMRDRLDIQGEGIGRIINDTEMETRREILWFGRERLTELPEAIRGRTPGDFISRAYRIITQGKPIALINEKFPYDIDRLPSHH